MYATPRIGSIIGRWLGKKNVAMHQQAQKQMMDTHKEEQYETTKQVLNKHLKNMSDMEALGLKQLIDELLDNEVKDVFDGRKALDNHIRGRLKSKKLIYEDHEKIRSYMEGLQFSDSNYKNSITVMPLLNPIPAGPVLVPAY